MKRTRREFVKLVGGAALGAGVVLAGRGMAGAQAKTYKNVPTGPLKIGVMTLLGGPGALLGAPGLKGVQICAEKINSEGGILGRKVELHVEEETTPKETVEKFRKLTVQDKVEVVLGLISSANGLAVGPVAEELQQLWLAWDATTEKGVEDQLPDAKYSFRAIDNGWGHPAAALRTIRFWPKIKTVAGINNDYAYGRDCWQAYTTCLKKVVPDLKLVLDLWPKYGEMEFSTHIAVIKKANPDLIYCSFWGSDVAAFIKQAYVTGLFKTTKAVIPNGGLVFESLKKDFTPEGIYIGYCCYYPFSQGAWPLNKWFIDVYYKKFKEFPNIEADNAYFTLQSYKAAVEKGYSLLGKWPTKEEIATTLLPGMFVPSISGWRGWTTDRRMFADSIGGLTRHKNPYDFVTVDDLVSPGSDNMYPAGTTWSKWTNEWKPGEFWKPA